jgi:hypothetical protein
MSTIRQSSMSVLLAGLLFGAASTAHAGLSVVTNVSAAGVYQNDYGTPDGKPMSSTLQAQNATSSAYARAYADYGVLKTYVAGYGTAYGTSSAVAGAGFNDYLTISNPELNGQVGTVTLSFHYDYDLAPHGNNEVYPGNTAGASYYAYAGVVGYYGNNYNSQINEYVSDTGAQTFRSGGVTTSDVFGLRYDPVGHTLSFTGQFVYGSAFMVYMNSSISGSTGTNQNGQTSSYVGDSYHSAYWGGILAATFDGQAVTDYTLSSQSGTDYSHSFVPAGDVPEPGALALFAAGLAGLLRVRRKKAM